jgi:hypothetical protein
MRSVEEILDSLDVSSFKNYNKDNCLHYILFMLTGNSEKDMSTIEVHDYYRYIYKHVEMLMDEEFQAETQIK